MAYRNQLLSEGKTIYHVFDVATNRKVASFLNENYAHNCAANRSFDNLLVVVEEHPSGHIQSTVYLDGEVLNETHVSTTPLPMSDTPSRIYPSKPKPDLKTPPIYDRPIPKPSPPQDSILKPIVITNSRSRQRTTS